MAQVNLLKPVMDTDKICVRCVPPHIKGVCRCEEPKLIPIKAWLHLDHSGNRDYINYYKIDL
jgi:hypothetical protein